MDLQISGIKDGVVIDHIPENKVFTLVELLKLNQCTDQIILGFNLDSKLLGKKGLIKISNRLLEIHELGAIALLTPNVTINVISDYKVVEKVHLVTPDAIEGIIQCTNSKCISNHQPIPSKYRKLKNNHKYKCFYCEKVIDEDEIVLKAR